MRAPAPPGRPPFPPSTPAEDPLRSGAVSRTAGLPFRIKLAIVSGAVVAVTLAIVLLPIWWQAKGAMTRLHGQRLAAIARTASIAIPAESLDVVAGPDGRASEAFVFARTRLRAL
jgi:hypothetical protein